MKFNKYFHAIFKEENDAQCKFNRIFGKVVLKEHFFIFTSNVQF